MRSDDMLVIVILLVLFVMYQKRNEFFGDGEGSIKNQVRKGFARVSGSDLGGY